MRGWRVVGSILMVVVPAVAGQLTGEVIIAKHLTKKTVSPTVYNLRGTAPPAPEKITETELDRTIVMIEGGKPSAAPPQTVQIEQRNSRFEPDLVVIPVGSTVEFPNEDPIFHNVFSLSGAQPFDLGYYPRSHSRSVKFNRSGIIQVYCHIHSNMYAAIVVTDSPWYGKPSADGSFSFANVPAGHYRALAWHKVAGLYGTDVDIAENGIAHVKIRVPVDVER